MEISKMLMLSTCHITEKTADWLKTDTDLVVFEKYKKSEYGWFIYVFIDGIEEYLTGVPDDLATILRYAAKLECVWICLESEGDINHELPVYVW